MVEFVELATIGARVNLAVKLGPGEGHSSFPPVGRTLVPSFRASEPQLWSALRSHKLFIYFNFS